MNSKGALIARACRGPILLITIGSLFAMQQAGFVSFERTWPLLIIVLGLMKLLERMFTPQSPGAARPYGPAYPSAAQAYPPTQPPPPPGGRMR